MTRESLTYEGRPASGRCAWVTAFALLLAGCGAAGFPAAAPDPIPLPAPLSLVVITGPSRRSLDQLVAVVGAGVTPVETLVLTRLATGPLGAAYVVRRGDSLNSIATSHHVSLAALEAANPQLGPVAGRDWNRIYPDDRLTIPDAQAGQPAANLLVTRAPSGPPAPARARLPERPANPTPFQSAQYGRALRAARASDDARLVTWTAVAARQTRPWQQQVIERLHALAAGLGQPEAARGTADAAAAVTAAWTTLAGLPGRRVLLLLDDDRLGPPLHALPAGLLAGVRLVVADVSDPASAAAWRGAAGGAASVTTLDPALTDLQLPAAVNGPDSR